ncbi:MAG: hypothetical protein ACRCR2_02575 [Fusobacteriaceae bacterium]
MLLIKTYQPAEDAFSSMVNKLTMWHYAIYNEKLYRWGQVIGTKKKLTIKLSTFGYLEAQNQIKKGKLFPAGREMRKCY